MLVLQERPARPVEIAGGDHLEVPRFTDQHFSEVAHRKCVGGMVEAVARGQWHTTEHQGLGANVHQASELWNDEAGFVPCGKVRDQRNTRGLGSQRMSRGTVFEMAKFVPAQRSRDDQCVSAYSHCFEFAEEGADFPIRCANVRVIFCNSRRGNGCELDVKEKGARSILVVLSTKPITSGVDNLLALFNV